MLTDGFGDAVSLCQVFDNQENHLSGETGASIIEENGIGKFWFHVDVQSSPFDILKEEYIFGG